MRKVIATRLVQSKGPVPHFYLAIEVNMQRVKELRESANLLDPELKLSYNDVILKACAAALRQNPDVKNVLMTTGDLGLKPDHYQEADAPPAWHYFDILTRLRTELQLRGTLDE